MLSLISRWFEETTSSVDYSRNDYWLLCLILGVGVILRFWGLGNVGLHGDEETMAMPAMAILEQGQPVLPSGMYYARALIQIYLMSGSVWLFGETEWALRLPSAIVGSLTGVAAFFMGRRFLAPQFNIAFVATIVLLPSLIAVSQTARMYVFFVTCVIWFAACIFRWERDQRISSLLLALFVWLLALHFQTLAIFSALLFVFPGLSNQSWRQVFQGAAAFAVGWIAFSAYSDWISGKYPDNTERPELPDEGLSFFPMDVLADGSGWLLIGSLIIIGLFGMLLVYKSIRRTDSEQGIPILLCTLGLLAIALLHYHIGGILLLLGIAFWFRAPGFDKRWIFLPLFLAAVLSVIHLFTLHGSGLYPGQKLIGALVGLPSIWPVLRFLGYSPIAGAIYVAAMIFMIVRFSRGASFPLSFLFFTIAVWLPLLILGVFAWDMPPRYAQGQLGFFLLAVFASLAYMAKHVGWYSSNQRLSSPLFVVLLLISAAFVNPVLLTRTVNAGYERHPDHKGAAEFIESLDLPSDAILVAEDSLQQAYYLGKVDYWLKDLRDVYLFSFVKDGQLFDQYTGAKVITTGGELMQLFDASSGREVYIIGSGENFVGEKRLFRGEGIAQVLTSDSLDVVFDGRDGKTKIWQLRQ